MKTFVPSKQQQEAEEGRCKKKRKKLRTIMYIKLLTATKNHSFYYKSDYFVYFLFLNSVNHLFVLFNVKERAVQDVLQSV
jgi:hypothetical protein